MYLLEYAPLSLSSNHEGFFRFLARPKKEVERCLTDKTLETLILL